MFNLRYLIDFGCKSTISKASYKTFRLFISKNSCKSILSDINYKIILVHEPDYIDTITSKYNNINLVLAGHSHNGQINIPYIKKLLLPEGSKKYYNNYYKVNNTNLYISSGLGESKINFRLFNKPSINFYRINKIGTK